MSIWKNNGTYRWRVQRDGRVIAGNSRTLEEAKACEARARLELSAGKSGVKIRRTLDEAFARYLSSPECTTLKDQRNILLNTAAWAPYLAGHAIEDAPECADRAVKDWLRGGSRNMAKGLQPATINRRLSLLIRMLNLAWKRWGWTAEPIAQRIEKLSENNERQVYLTADDVTRLRRACKDLDSRAAITLLACTGARYSELANADRSQVIDGVLYLHARTKRGKPRAVPILPPGLRYISRAFPFRVTYRKVRYHFDLAKVAIGMPNLHLHDLRHTTASWIVQSGGTLKDAGDWLGHTNPVTTQRYTHLNIQRALEVAANISKNALKRRDKKPA